MSTHQVAMSTLIDTLIPASNAKRLLEQIAGRRLPKSTLRRWRSRVGAELRVVGGRHYYTASDLANCEFIARYLKKDRNLDRAVVALFEDLRNVAN